MSPAGGHGPPQPGLPKSVFTCAALKVEKLEVPKDATASLAGFMVNANSIGKTTLTGKYGRKK